MCIVFYIAAFECSTLSTLGTKSADLRPGIQIDQLFSEKKCKKSVYEYRVAQVFIGVIGPDQMIRLKDQFCELIYEAKLKLFFWSESRLFELVFIFPSITDRFCLHSVVPLVNNLSVLSDCPWIESSCTSSPKLAMILLRG